MKLFTKNKKTCTNDLIDAEIEQILNVMSELEIGSDDYNKLVNTVERLQKLKDFKKKVSPDTALVVGSNLLIAIMVIKHEELHVLTSKAMGFIIKGRV